jgi:uncharacterized protein YjbI with pentapeptide repeats
MPDPEEDQQAEKREAVTEQRCQVLMSNQQRCGLPIHAAPPGVDLEPVCLMHSKDPNKSDAAFQEEFERILRDAGEGEADFTRFVFPSANYGRREFRAICHFYGAAFKQGVDFYRATFTQGAVFFGATFTQNANFGGATFTQNANFRGATFTQNANFRGATFMQNADFSDTTFTQNAHFDGATFTQSAYFLGATFTRRASFREVRFAQGVEFFGVQFEQVADFNQATFERGAEISNAMFTDDAFFIGVRFEGRASFSGGTFANAAFFSGVTFMQAADFSFATFTQRADFCEAAFKERVEFRETKFREDASAQPGPVFNLARFEKPEMVVFYNTCLGQALFHNCDVSRFVFSSVRWRQRSNGKRMVLEEDEELDLSQGVTRALRTEQGEVDERNYGLIAELYQQLKKNYDDRKDYWTAGDFHYGEMEMKRQATPQRNRFFQWLAEKIKKSLDSKKPSRLAHWAKRKGYSERSFHVFRHEWHRHVGLAALYKYASEYGESYNRPLLWLVGVLLFFTLLYPLWGLHPTLNAGSAQAAAHESLSREAGVPELSYRNLIRYGSLQPGGDKLSLRTLLGHSLMTSVGVAALQRDLAYEPSYPWGRALSWLELALTSTFIALFLLAVRRQFRR